MSFNVDLPENKDCILNLLCNIYKVSKEEIVNKALIEFINNAETEIKSLGLIT